MALEVSMEGSAPPDLDAWLAAPLRRTSHRRVADADADRLWRAAMGVRLRDCRLLGRLVRVRLGIGDGELTFERLFHTAPFTALDEGPGWSVSGAAGRIWSTRSDLATLPGARAFREWDEPGTARVLFAHWVTPLGASSAALCSEVRVAPTDRRAALRLRALEPFIVAFQSLIGVEALALAVRRAEDGVTS